MTMREELRWGLGAASMGSRMAVLMGSRMVAMIDEVRGGGGGRWGWERRRQRSTRSGMEVVVMRFGSSGRHR
ncbi:hypothetical protein GUJ93_ZPchr0012g19402 [Zizania palustris]|uniref:Uncharacterized protein n=1 Tax=Zizania palustris TaxID=103762 RepID=A0A8J5WPM4_ZIZPA|nr:hypothetical protein GUJ93_ZPchr0012g19402 [Zizania palustris]